MRKMRDDDELFCELWRLCDVQLTIDPIVSVQLHALVITLFSFLKGSVSPCCQAALVARFE